MAHLSLGIVRLVIRVSYEKLPTQVPPFYIVLLYPVIVETAYREFGCFVLWSSERQNNLKSPPLVNGFLNPTNKEVVCNDPSRLHITIPADKEDFSNELRDNPLYSACELFKPCYTMAEEELAPFWRYSCLFCFARHEGFSRQLFMAVDAKLEYYVI